jgi:Ca-activated chloride channel family protein
LGLLLASLISGLLLSGFPAWAQSRVSPDIVEVPPRPSLDSYEVKAVELSVDIRDQTAKVLLRQTVRNTGNGILELDFLAPLPLNGSVSGLTLVADGKELAGQIYPKDEAFRIYQNIVSQLRDPALLEFAGQGLYRARAFPVERGKEATLDLSMEYLLPKDGGRVDLDFPLANSLTQGRTVGRQEISVRIRGANIGGVFSPQDGVKIERSGDMATVALDLEKVPPLSSFQLHYQEAPGPMGGMVLSHKPDPREDGYFLFLAEPSGAAEPEGPGATKTVVFVLDRSGSMSGSKFRQAKAALSFVLERLDPDDRFDLIDFSSDISLWRPEIEAMSPSSRSEAQNYVKSLRAGGGTNIEEALAAALALEFGDDPAYLIFLTDGEPTEGETDEIRLADVVKKADRDRGVRIFSFGVGERVNARLLERLSGGSSGSTAFVAPQENIEDKVSSFFSKITYPALVKPALDISLRTNRLIPSRLPDLFRGTQLAVVGRYPAGGEATLTLAGQEGSERRSYTYRAELARGPSANGQQIARLWAQRRAGQIIEEIDLAARSTPNPELVDELVELSRRYGIMTPYTSFLAAEDQQLTDSAALRRPVEENLANLDQVTGADANWQRERRASLASAAAAAPQPMQEEKMVQELEEMGRLDRAAQSRLVPPTVIDGRGFFLKDGRLIEGDLSEADLADLKPIERFGDEYFELAQKLSPGQMPLLTQAYPLAFRLNGQTYLIAAK